MAPAEEVLMIAAVYRRLLSPRRIKLADGEGIEPPRASASSVFKTAAVAVRRLDHPLYCYSTTMA